MTIALELPPDLEERLVAEAKAMGVPVEEVVKANLYKAISTNAAKPLSTEEMNKLLDEAADLIPEGIPPLSDAAMSRESIYSREDDWKS